jgi:hypothetical protein
MQAREERRNSVLLSFDELITLSSTAKPEGPLGARLETLLTTPFLDSDVSAAGIQPHRPGVGRGGITLLVMNARHLRVRYWGLRLNIHIVVGNDLPLAFVLDQHLQ